MRHLTATSDEEARTHVKTAAKTLLLLNAFESSSEVVGVCELSRRSALPKSTTHRVLRVLVDAGFVHHLSSGYQLSDHVTRLGNSATTRFATTLRPLLLPVLVDLHQTTGSPVSLSLLEGGLVRCVERVHSLRQAALAQAFPDDVPAHTSASGKAVLAFTRHIRPMTESAASRTVRPELDRVRSFGLAVEQAASATGPTMISAPILGPDRSAVAALSVLVTGPASRMDLTTSRLRAGAHTCTMIVAAQRMRSTGASPAAS